MPFTLDKLPFYAKVPKTVPENLAYREELLGACAESLTLRQDAWIMAARDPFWYWNTFGFLLEPRATDTPSTIPFVTWPRQDEILLEILNAVNDGYDLHIKKSRGVGVSWNVLLVFEWFWHFKERQHFLVHSKKEDLVDKIGDPDTLLYKLDFWCEHLPDWLRPTPDRKKNHVGNADLRGTIDGGSTTDDVARGGRRRAIFCDEFAAVKEGAEIVAAVSEATECTIYGSTSKGIGTEFYRLESAPICHVQTRWHEYPLQRAGLYRVTNGSVEILDKECRAVKGLDAHGRSRVFAFPDEYPFVTSGIHFTDGGLRSPYYDRRCAHFTDPLLRAQELDLDDIGAGDPFFPRRMIEPLKANAFDPAWIGDLDYDPQTKLPRIPYAFVAREGGPLKLWVAPDSAGLVPLDMDYCWGADISQGSGATPSVLIVINRETGEQVGEYATPTVTPSDFAHVANAVGRLFAGKLEQAFACWEANGPGNAFGKKLYGDLEYRRIYFREGKDVRKRPTYQPGWHSSTAGKIELFNDFRDALQTGRLVLRSRGTLQDCYNYSHDGRGGIVNQVQPTSRAGGGGARYSHGDFAAAAACGILGLKPIISLEEKKRSRESPIGCMAARVREDRRETRVASIDEP